MKPARRMFAMGLGLGLTLCFCIPAFAAPYPTADQLREALAEITAQVKSEKLEVEILDAQKEGVTRPLMAAGLGPDGVCVVYFNTKPEEALARFFESVPAQDMPVWLNSIAVHEITHCIEQREAYVRHRFDKVLPPGISGKLSGELPGERVTVQGYLSVVHSGALDTWGEALADIASVIYFKQAAPQRWQQFAGELANMRSDNAGKWPEHDTSPWLRKIIAASIDQPANSSLFEAAFQLRRQYSPAHAAPAIGTDPT